MACKYLKAVDRGGLPCSGFAKLSFLISLALVLIGGCGSSGGSDSVADEYPVLAEYAELDQADVERMQEEAEAESKSSRIAKDGGDSNKISIDTAMTFIVGTAIDSKESTFLNNPVLDLGALYKEGNLEIQSRNTVKETGSISITSSFHANEYSTQCVQEHSASVGAFGFSSNLSFQHEHKYSTTSSSGDTYIKMSYGNTGAYVKILDDSFEGSDFTRFLKGTRLSSDEVGKYVVYTEEYVSRLNPLNWDKYVVSVDIKKNGICDDRANVYGSVQLIGEMERLFYKLKDQYGQYGGNAKIAKTLIKNMKKLRANIANAIDSFYSRNGDRFVSRIDCMNYGLANATLITHSETSETESGYGASISVKYSELVTEGSGETRLQYAKKSGWESSFSEITAQADSLPTGTIDVTGWETELTEMLQNEDSKFTVPSLALNENVEDNPPEATDPQNQATDSPQSYFETFNEWNNYLNAEKTDSGQDATLAGDAKDLVGEKGVYDTAVTEPEKTGCLETFTNYVEELGALAGEDALLALAAAKTDGSNNQMGIKGMFVSGFTTRSYSEVIPALRPDLDIPTLNPEQALEGYPNASALLMILNKLGQLDSYLAFISNFQVSRISSDYSDNFHAFYENCTKTAMKLLDTQFVNGLDVHPVLLQGFGERMFGRDGQESKSVLYLKMGDVSAYNYIMNLLEPDRAKIWSTAPGGYLPFSAKQNKDTFFSPALGVSGDKITYLGLQYDRPDESPLGLFENDQAREYAISAWYPVFQYNNNNNGDVNLLFLQLSGPYQLVYGSKFILAPAASDGLEFKTIAYDDKHTFGKDAVEAMADPGNSLLGESVSITEDEVLDPDDDLKNGILYTYMPLPVVIDDSQDREERFNSLMIILPKTDDDASDSGTGYRLYTPENALADFYIPNDEDEEYGRYFLILLPVNKTSCANRFDQAFSYATALTATEIINESSFTPAYKAAVMRQKLN